MVQQIYFRMRVIKEERARLLAFFLEDERDTSTSITPALPSLLLPPLKLIAARGCSAEKAYRRSPVSVS